MDERAADTVQAASIQENSASEEIKEDVQEPGKDGSSGNGDNKSGDGVTSKNVGSGSGVAGDGEGVTSEGVTGDEGDSKQVGGGDEGVGTEEGVTGEEGDVVEKPKEGEEGTPNQEEQGHKEGTSEDTSEPKDEQQTADTEQKQLGENQDQEGAAEDLQKDEAAVKEDTSPEATTDAETTETQGEPSDEMQDKLEPDGAEVAAEGQEQIEEPEADVTPRPQSEAESRGEEESVVMIDGVPVLEDIVEEAEEGEGDEMADVAMREALLEKIKTAMEEKERLEVTNMQVQHEIAEYLARKKDDEKADPGRTVIDHEKKYFQCMTMLDHLQEEIDDVNRRNQLQEDEMMALRDQKFEELEKTQAEFVKYRKEKVLNVVDQRTGRKLTARDVDDYQAAEDKKDKEIVQVRLESIKLQNKTSKLEAMIKQKEQLVGGLHLIDFEQLKINNIDLNEKIEERNDDILKLKKKVTSTVEVLTHVKEKLQFLQAENAEKKEALRDIEAVVAKKRDHMTRLKRARDSLRADNLRLRQKGGLVGQTALLRDFEERQDQSQEMYERLEKLQKRQAELAIMCDVLKKKIEQAKYVTSQT